MCPAPTTIASQRRDASSRSGAGSPTHPITSAARVVIAAHHATIGRMNAEHELRSRLADLERRVAQLERLAGATPPPPPAAEQLSPQAQAHVQSGRIIDAIKQHRADTGLGLAEAKRAVERYAAMAGLS